LKSLYDASEKQEITISYVDPLLTLPERQNELQKKWGFVCTCMRCQEEEEYDLKWRLKFKELQQMVSPEHLLGEVEVLQHNLTQIFKQIESLESLVAS
jgi:hypothetical protein